MHTCCYMHTCRYSISTIVSTTVSQNPLLYWRYLWRISIDKQLCHPLTWINSGIRTIRREVCMLSHSILSDSLWPTWLLCPWDFPGKNTGAEDCHFLLQGIFLTQGLNLRLLRLLNWQVDSLQLSYQIRVCVCVCVLVTQSCPTLCDPVDCSPSGSSVHGILQAVILEWIAIPFSRGSSQPRDRTPVSYITGRFFIIWATREAHLHI